ncbi:hypothetical protein ACQ33O_04050 [Ferruginibacter sp. SUN002]|uniref:hypothetical protein n=1 Tax=Ferruginibacter sp. SUN002 TaxID=2937789 RepID=UPI003D35DCFF
MVQELVDWQTNKNTSSADPKIIMHSHATIGPNAANPSWGDKVAAKDYPNTRNCMYYAPENCTVEYNSENVIDNEVKF